MKAKLVAMGRYDSGWQVSKAAHIGRTVRTACQTLRTVFAYLFRGLVAHLATIKEKTDVRCGVDNYESVVVWGRNQKTIKYWVQVLCGSTHETLKVANFNADEIGGA